ncbi:pectinesterase family protein [Hufsiella ginkgonis]|uniref:Pectinesterase n=1 Tax=Hufsiella ginkgonis TaxID=2695274 RepID=A0A7K1XU54_9SPHI|nr:pectinesterase family protein [Hufsiella ginkgonis]MXV14480.1 pectin esterase [Hufsiella ginkgonis]
MKKLLAFLLLTFSPFAGSAQQATYPSTLTVAQDGSGNYKTIQEAVNSTRDLGAKVVKIFIKNGTYHEKLIIPSWKTAISLVGEDKEKTIITGDDYSGKNVPGGKDAYGRDKFNTYTSYTMLVQGNDFSAENLTIRNTAGRVGQAVALHVEGDRCRVTNCLILGNQDTLYLASANSRQLYTNCYIEGTTDFIFGEATVIFRGCTIKSLTDSYVTAAATTPQQRYGFVFFDCKLVADPSVKRAFLGRPWRPYAKTVFINTEMGSHILPQGWDPWKGDAMFPDKEKTAFYAEYGSTGAGAGHTRVTWAKRLTKREVKSLYTWSKIFSKPNTWDIVQ